MLLSTSTLDFNSTIFLHSDRPCWRLSSPPLLTPRGGCGKESAHCGNIITCVEATSPRRNVSSLMDPAGHKQRHSCIRLRVLSKHRWVDVAARLHRQIVESQKIRLVWSFSLECWLGSILFRTAADAKFFEMTYLFCVIWRLRKLWYVRLLWFLHLCTPLPEKVYAF